VIDSRGERLLSVSRLPQMQTSNDLFLFSEKICAGRFLATGMFCAPSSAGVFAAFFPPALGILALSEFPSPPSSIERTDQFIELYRTARSGKPGSRE
jgi:hypothetical protein